MRPPGTGKIKVKKTLCFFTFGLRFSVLKRFFFFSMCLVGRPGRQFLISELFGGWCLPFLLGRNIGFYRVVVLFAYKNYILQHGENCVNTCVLARHWHKNIVNTVTLAAGSKKQCKYHGFGFPKRKNIGIYIVFCSEGLKNMRKQNLFDDFRADTNAKISYVARTTTTTTTTTTTRTKMR